MLVISLFTLMRRIYNASTFQHRYINGAVRNIEFELHDRRDTWRCPAMEAYCLKCKGQREVKNPTEKTLKNGRPATEGICSECGSKVFRIGKAS